MKERSTSLHPSLTQEDSLAKFYIHFPYLLTYKIKIFILISGQWRTQEFCSLGVQQIQLRTEDGSPLVRGSGGSCNLVQEISFHIVKFS